MLEVQRCILFIPESPGPGPRRGSVHAGWVYFILKVPDMGKRTVETKSGIWLRFQKAQLAQLKDAMGWQGGIGRWDHFTDVETEVQPSLLPCRGQAHGLSPQRYTGSLEASWNSLQERTSREPREEMDFSYHLAPNLTNTDHWWPHEGNMPVNLVLV